MRAVLPTSSSMCREQQIPRPHLVVVPLSTLPNWEREFATWAPQLNVVMLHGNQEARAVVWHHEMFVPSVPGERGHSNAGRQVSTLGIASKTVQVARAYKLSSPYWARSWAQTASKSMRWPEVLCRRGSRCMWW